MSVWLYFTVALACWVPFARVFLHWDEPDMKHVRSEYREDTWRKHVQSQGPGAVGFGFLMALMWPLFVPAALVLRVISR